MCPEALACHLCLALYCGTEDLSLLFAEEADRPRLCHKYQMNSVRRQRLVGLHVEEHCTTLRSPLNVNAK